MSILKKIVELSCCESYYWNIKNNKTLFKVPYVLCGNIYNNNKSLIKFNSTLKFNLMDYDPTKFNSSVLCIYIDAFSFDNLIPINLSVTIPSDSDSNTISFELEDISENYLELDISQLVKNINFKTTYLTLILSIIPKDVNTMIQIESEISYHPPYIKSTTEIENLKPKVDPNIVLLNQVIDNLTSLSNEYLKLSNDISQYYNNLTEIINELNTNNIKLLDKIKNLSIQSINI